MLCPKCSNENPDDIQACQHCNAPLMPNKDEAKINPKTSGYAIAALIFGILIPFTACITFIPALIFGIIAVVKINNSHGQLKGLRLAIYGIVIPIIILLLIETIGSIRVGRRFAQRAVCSANLSGLYKAMRAYALDNRDNYPTPSQWCDLLKKNYNLPDANFICPCGEQWQITYWRLGWKIKKGRCSYAINPNAINTNCPNDMVLLFETTDGWNKYGGPEILSLKNHQGKGMIVLFANRDIKFVKSQDVNSLKWK
jgi:hypothetical protein